MVGGDHRIPAPPHRYGPGPPVHRNDHEGAGHGHDSKMRAGGGVAGRFQPQPRTGDVRGPAGRSRPGAPGADPDRRPPGSRIFGTDHGLCGPFNDDVATHALAELDRLEPRPERRTVLDVGTRLADFLTERGQPLAAVLNAPSSLGGVTPLVQDLLVRIDQLRMKRERLRVLLVYNRHFAGPVGDGNRFQTGQRPLSTLCSRHARRVEGEGDVLQGREGGDKVEG